MIQKILIFSGFLWILSGVVVKAGADSSPLNSGVYLAQFEADETYDPFADYSEFEESAEEESDINFFRNGRFFTLGFIGGYRTFTDTMADIYEPAVPSYGLFLSYFFDLRFAMQVSFLTGDHTIGFRSPQGTEVRGNAVLTSLGLSLKYYLNTQNVTKGLAQFNPYFTGGFSQVYRTATVSGQEAFAKDGARSFDAGVGMEVPIMNNKMYLGAQLTYQLATFKDENTQIVLSNGTEPTGLYPTGDLVHLLGIFGFNF